MFYCPSLSLPSMNPFVVFSGHDDAVRCLALSVDGILYTGSNDEKILAWDLHTQQPLRAFCGHSGPVSCLYCTSHAEGEPTILFSGSFDQSVRSWDVATGKQTQAFFGHAVRERLRLRVLPQHHSRVRSGAWTYGKASCCSRGAQTILPGHGM